MKKTYFAPEIKVVKVQTAAGLLAGSFLMYDVQVDRDAALSPNLDLLWDVGED